MIKQHTINTVYPVGPVHCYSAELGHDLVLFDTGPPSEEARKCLSTEVDLARLAHVVITHCHIDHCGLVSWLEEQTAATIYLPYRDALKIAGHEERLGRMNELLLQIGFDQAFVEGFRKGLSDGEVFPRHPERYLVVESDLPGHLGIEVSSCPGHSQSDLVLTGSDWAVTGDVLLRDIFQVPLLDIDLETGRRFHNYHAYCETLAKLAALRGKRILPGHRDEIDSVDGTILFYVGKLLDRAAHVKRFPSSHSVARIVEQLFGGGKNHPFHYYLKTSEIVFMRDFLQCPDLLRTALKQIGLFDAVADKFRRTV